MNTNRDIKRFETDENGKTMRVLLNTDEPLGLLDEDFQAQLDEINRKLNSIINNQDLVRIEAGGTAANNANSAMTNLVSLLAEIDDSTISGLDFVAQKTTGEDSGTVYRVPQGIMANLLGMLDKSNNLSDLENKITALGNLLTDVEDVTPQGGIPLVAWIDDLKLLLGHYISTPSGVEAEPCKISMKDIVDDYLSEYFTKRTNDLNDLSSIPNAVKNLFDGLSDTGVPVLNDYVEIIANKSTLPDKSTLPAGTGKITLGTLFENWLNGAINAEYGFTRDTQTNEYSFDGTSSKSETALTAIGLSMSGGSVNMQLKSTLSQLQTLSGDGTVILSSANDDFGVDDLILGFSIILDEGANGAVIKDFSQERVKSAQSEGSLTVTVNVTGNSILGNPSKFYVQCYYMTNINA